jgi:hypothetical protein
VLGVSKNGEAKADGAAAEPAPAAKPAPVSATEEPEKPVAPAEAKPAEEQKSDG